ncbi:TMEM175 family protein [Streptomyces sp. NPDC005799]|uniref:TMEM175 family protein n=1 Tax=Streptomyces sp. NPDC005799 TaxID=3154678 RepID=UPI0033FC94A7
MAEAMAQTAAEPHQPTAAPVPVSPERLIYFSDAVVAIAITLLALELPVPGGDAHGDSGVLHFLREHLTEYVAFLVSFSAIAVHWMVHQRLFRYATGLTGSVIRWNLLWLLTIVVTPFTTKLLTSEADAFRIQFITYAAVQVLTGLSFRLAFADLRRSGLLRADTPPGAVEDTLIWVTAMITTFTLSIPLALATHWASLSWCLLPLTRLALDRLGRRIKGTTAG